VETEELMEEGDKVPAMDLITYPLIGIKIANGFGVAKRP
jgi:hypothetical protein